MIKKLERNRVILEYGIYTTEITRFSKRRKKQKRCVHLHIKQGGEKNGAKYKGFVVHCFRTCSFFFFLETISEQLIWRTLIMAEKRMFNTKISLSLLECNGWFTIFFFFFYWYNDVYPTNWKRNRDSSCSNNEKIFER